MTWTRAETDAAIQVLDGHIAAMLGQAPMNEIWAVFNDAAFEIQTEAGHEMWRAAVQLDRMALRHGLLGKGAAHDTPLASSDA